MRRVVLFVLISLLSLSVFAEPLTGIFDVKFGDNQKTVASKLKNKGWVFSPDGIMEDDIHLYTKENGTYGKLDVKTLFILFDNSKMNQVSISFETDYHSFKDLIKTLIYTYQIKDAEISDAALITGKSEDTYTVTGRSENNIKVTGRWISKDICTLDFEDMTNSDL